MEQLIKFKGDVYQYVNGGVIRGYTKSKIPEGDAFIEWHGSKMPHELYQSILAFFAWTYDDDKNESLVHLYYNEAEKSWLAWAPPQRGVGMTVKTIDDHPNWKQAEEFVGYVKVGTGHHHCASAAFQSGTDHADECSGNGLHFTVGGMDKQFHSIHARAVFNGNMLETTLNGWVELAPKYRNIPNLPEELIERAYDYSLQARAPKGAQFPQVWKDNFIKGGYTSYNQGTQAGFGGGRSGYWKTINGQQEWVSLTDAASHHHTSVGTSMNLTAAEKGEIELEGLLRGGIGLTQMALLAQEMIALHRGQWSKSKEMKEVAAILDRHGLNARWFAKWVCLEDSVRVACERSDWQGGA